MGDSSAGAGAGACAVAACAGAACAVAACAGAACAGAACAVAACTGTSGCCVSGGGVGVSSSIILVCSRFSNTLFFRDLRHRQQHNERFRQNWINLDDADGFLIGIGRVVALFAVASVASVAVAADPAALASYFRNVSFSFNWLFDILLLNTTIPLIICSTTFVSIIVCVVC